MKRAIISGLGLLGLATAPAIAADIPVKAPIVAPVIAAYSWTGCHIGGNVGGKWARNDDTVNISAATGPGGASAASGLAFGRSTASTFIGGGQVGCDWQSGSWVFGIEGDADWQRWRTTRTVVAPAPALFIPGDSFEVRSDWQASLRGRIGYAWDRWMIYGTGGVAFTRVIANANWIAVGIFPATFASESKTLIGPTAGLGVEYAFANNWSLALEGRYSWYGSTTFNAGLLATSAIGAAAPVFTFAPTSQTVRVETFELTARLNWKF